MLRTLAFVTAAMLAGTASAAPAQFAERTVDLHGKTYRYQVFIPADIKPHPAVVLFLHGSGERGSDNQKQLSQGLPPWLKEHMDFPAVVVIPQAPDDTEWTDPDDANMALAALEKSVKEFHGDRKRLYLTGLSMGGYGSWQLAVDFPDKFAAAAIICGGITQLPDPEGRRLFLQGVPAGKDPFAWAAEKIGKTPVWIFHGGDDNVVPTEQSRKMNAALVKRGAEVKYTEFPGVNHGSWMKAYATPDLWEWMFQHHR
ncbi:prolyl oligopeptidase family serine peptidase [Luteibacter aegosomaticola]|jgi:predicted peptidase|uniref:carboxylesterase family protein n=1 Tax=Luteibacter aegosomaticola TaxID=2911538 RepID=UPI001FF70444|nr:prolyl oligopeptidase family serine peptidase [Luteibacter aegosomaticola]UPG91014.1 prolyl oligopeptidase family serine peptidase [Luteibacter aegosomaticola]